MNLIRERKDVLRLHTVNDKEWEGRDLGLFPDTVIWLAGLRKMN